METRDYVIWYRSCEGLERWMLGRFPAEMSESEIRYRVIANGGVGDDPAEVLTVEETYEHEYEDVTHYEEEYR